MKELGSGSFPIRWAPAASPVASKDVHLPNRGVCAEHQHSTPASGSQHADAVLIYGLILENLTSRASHGTIIGKNQGIPHVSFPPKHFVFRLAADVLAGKLLKKGLH